MKTLATLGILYLQYLPCLPMIVENMTFTSFVGEHPGIIAQEKGFFKAKR
ncbi:hypothetical protein [Nostoc sp.]